MECKLMPGDRVMLRPGARASYCVALAHGQVYTVAEVLVGYGRMGPRPCVRVEGIDYPRLRRPSEGNDRKMHLASIFERLCDISSLERLLATRSLDELVQDRRVEHA